MCVVTGAALPLSAWYIFIVDVSSCAAAPVPENPLSSARAVGVPSAMMAPSTCRVVIQRDDYYIGQPTFWISGKPAILRRNRTEEEEPHIGLRLKLLFLWPANGCS